MLDRHDALIFDCDGVLVNSEQIALTVEIELLAALGVDYPPPEYQRRYAGTSERGFREALRSDARARFGVELSERFFDELSATIRAAFETRLAPIDGAYALAAGWPKPKAVASSSAQSHLDFKLARTGFAALFGKHVYSAERVPAGKPDPAVFLLAAQGLGALPERCVVIEDSVNGVVAAKRAGMTAIGFAGGGHCLDGHAEELLAAGADVVFATHAEIARQLDIAAERSDD